MHFSALYAVRLQIINIRSINRSNCANRGSECFLVAAFETARQSSGQDNPCERFPLTGSDLGCTASPTLTRAEISSTLEWLHCMCRKRGQLVTSKPERISDCLSERATIPRNLQWRRMRRLQVIVHRPLLACPDVPPPAQRGEDPVRGNPSLRLSSSTVANNQLEGSEEVVAPRHNVARSVLDAEVASSRARLMELVPTMSNVSGAGNALDVDQLLAILAQVKIDIMADIRRQHGELQKSLEEKILLLTTVMDRVHTQVLRMAIDAKSHELSGPQTKKRKLAGLDPPLRMDHLEILANSENGMEEHLMFLLLVTVLSFALNNTEFMCWLDQGTQRRMTPHYSVLKATSGFSVLFFAGNKTLGNRKFRTAPARAWSVALRWVLAKKVDKTRPFLEKETERLGGNVQTCVPAWLESFCKGVETYNAVNTVVAVEELTDGYLNLDFTGSTASSSSRERHSVSKRRQESVAESKRRKNGLTGNHSPLLEARVYAVQKARTKFMERLTGNRNDARKVLFRELFFLVGKIASFLSADEARGQGYEIVFNTSDAPSDENMHMVGPLQLWKIDLAGHIDENTTSENAQRIRQSNMAKFEYLQNRFQFMSLQLKYKRGAKHPASGDMHYLDEVEDCNLYKVIGTCSTMGTSWRLPCYLII